MIESVERFDSTENCVWKYVFEFTGAIAEAVLYRYNSFEERTVICCSVQSGCPVGCTFCGTGRHFIRSLSSQEICDQVYYVLQDQKINPMKVNRFQIMFMSMGEPMLNWENVATAIRALHFGMPNAELLVSTVGIYNVDTMDRMIYLSKEIDKIGLQFSIHSVDERERRQMMPYRSVSTLVSLSEFGHRWHQEVGRKPFINYFATPERPLVPGGNLKAFEILFPPEIFNVTLSVICHTDRTPNLAKEEELKYIHDVRDTLLAMKYNVRVFDPAGQDDIGGGCGQLWYVQDYFEEARHGR